MHIQSLVAIALALLGPTEANIFKEPGNLISATGRSIKKMFTSQGSQRSTRYFNSFVFQYWNDFVQTAMPDTKKEYVTTTQALKEKYRFRTICKNKCDCSIHLMAAVKKDEDDSGAPLHIYKCTKADTINFGKAGRKAYNAGRSILNIFRSSPSKRQTAISPRDCKIRYHIGKGIANCEIYFVSMDKSQLESHDELMRYDHKPRVPDMTLSNLIMVVNNERAENKLVEDSLYRHPIEMDCGTNPNRKTNHMTAEEQTELKDIWKAKNHGSPEPNWDTIFMEINDKRARRVAVMEFFSGSRSRLAKNRPDGPKKSEDVDPQEFIEIQKFVQNELKDYNLVFDEVAISVQLEAENDEDEKPKTSKKDSARADFIDSIIKEINDKRIKRKIVMFGANGKREPMTGPEIAELVKTFPQLKRKASSIIKKWIFSGKEKRQKLNALNVMGELAVVAEINAKRKVGKQNIINYDVDLASTEPLTPAEEEKIKADFANSWDFSSMFRPALPNPYSVIANSKKTLDRSGSVGSDLSAHSDTPFITKRKREDKKHV